MTRTVEIEAELLCYADGLTHVRLLASDRAVSLPSDLVEVISSDAPHSSVCIFAIPRALAEEKGIV